jgi:hypothetical protein
MRSPQPLAQSAVQRRLAPFSPAYRPRVREDRLPRAAGLPHAIDMADLAQPETGIDNAITQLWTAQSLADSNEAVALIERRSAAGDARASEP